MSPLVPHSTPADAGPGVIEFIKGTEFNSLPQEVVAQAVRCVFDLLGVAAGATATDMSRIARDYGRTSPNIGVTWVFVGGSWSSILNRTRFVVGRSRPSKRR